MANRFQTVLVGGLGLLLAAGCSDDDTTPTDPAETPGLTIVSGNSQTGVAGEELADPLVVRVTTETGEAVAGASVSWSVTTGGGSIDPPTATTDANGEAETDWVLGGALGEQTVSVTAAGLTNVFRATAADSRLPDVVIIIGGDNQSAGVGRQLLNPLIVRVENRFGRPVSDVEVEWKVETGGGLVTPSGTTTDSDGRGQVQWTLGPVAGLQTAVANVGGISARFRATAR